MFAYFVPIGVGLLITVLSVRSLIHSGWYRRRWPWIGALLGSLLLWVPAVVLFMVAPQLWPQVNRGSTDAYYQLMNWQILWIFLGIPVGLISVLVFLALGRPRREAV
jgi:Na+(H+)/acetate symporter ActP